MKIWISIISIALVGIAVFVLRYENAQRAQQAQTRTALADMSQHLNEVSQQATQTRLQALAREVPHRNDSTWNATQEPETSDMAATASPDEDIEAAPALEVEEVRDWLDMQLHEEGVDSSWSREATHIIHQRIATTLPTRSAVESVECHASMCRIETVHATLEDYQQFVRDSFIMSETQMWNGGFFASIVGEPAAGEELTTVAYLARDGEALPMPGAPGENGANPYADRAVPLP